MRLASKEDFFNGSIYTSYHHHEGYAKRAALFKWFPEPILVVGCGFGFLVKEFENLGKVACGIDASAYAVENRVHRHVRQISILQAPQSEHQFDTVVTEDLLPFLTDEEAKEASKNCAKLGGIVIHMVTEQGEADLNYHSCGYWMTLTGQLTTSLEGM